MSEGNFEAVKVSYRQTKDGMVVAFAIHPNDAPGELATLKLGTRLMLAWAAINDDETMAGAAIAPQADSSLGSAVSARNPSGSPAPKPKREWKELPAAARAALLCKDPQFRSWMRAADEEQCATILRRQCGITSRAQLDTNPDALELFWRIEGQYYKRHEPPPRTDDT